MDAYLQLMVSCYLYKKIIRQKKKDFGEIKKLERILMLGLHSIFLCEWRLYLHIVVCGCICDC